MLSPKIRNVVLLGADSKLGPALLHALGAHDFRITILKRQSSTSPDTYFPAVQNILRCPDNFSIASLVPLLTGQDAVIASLRGGQEGADLLMRLADASAQAGVKRFIPADFGSVDSSSDMTQRLVPPYVRKTQVGEHCQLLAEKYPEFSWTSLVCGHFLDWSLEFMHLFLRERRADIIDGGTTKFSLSTRRRVAEATAGILRMGERETGNRILYVQSFCVTQREIVEAFERALGGEKWDLVRVDSRQFEVEEKLKADKGDMEAVEKLIWLLGVLDADWRKKEGFAMDLLGLRDEDLDAEVRNVVASIPAKEISSVL